MVDHDYIPEVQEEDNIVPSWVNHTCRTDIATLFLILTNMILFLVTFLMSIFVFREMKKKILMGIYDEQNDENEFDVGDLAVDDVVVINEEYQNMRNIESRYSVVDEDWLKDLPKLVINDEIAEERTDNVNNNGDE